MIYFFIGFSLVFFTADMCSLQHLKDGEDFHSLKAKTQGDQGQHLYVKTNF